MYCCQVCKTESSFFIRSLQAKVFWSFKIFCIAMKTFYSYLYTILLNLPEISLLMVSSPSSIPIQSDPSFKFFYNYFLLQPKLFWPSLHFAPSRMSKRIRPIPTDPWKQSWLKYTLYIHKHSNQQLFYQQVMTFPTLAYCCCFVVVALLPTFDSAPFFLIHFCSNHRLSCSVNNNYYYYNCLWYRCHCYYHNNQNWWLYLI